MFGRVVYRCIECRKFVRHRRAVCRSCQYDHGSPYSWEAEPIT